jgi:hypothetical protein
VKGTVKKVGEEDGYTAVKSNIVDELTGTQVVMMLLYYVNALWEITGEILA